MIVGGVGWEFLGLSRFSTFWAMKSILFACVVSLLFLSLFGCTGAKVLVESTPRGAAVFVGDSAVGATPWSGVVGFGLKKITVENPGYSIHLKTLDVQRGTLRSYLGASLMLGGAGAMYMGLYGMSPPFLPLIYTGMGSHLGGLIYYSFSHDYTVSAELNQKSGPLVRSRKLQYVGNERFQFDYEKKLYHTDSICLESSRKTLWTYDAQKDQSRPLAIAAVQRCDPGLGSKSSRPPFWKFWGWSSLTVAGIGTGAIIQQGGGVKADEIVPLGLGSVAAGALLAWYVWAQSPDFERCEEILDAITVRDWARKFPCYDDAPQEPVAPVVEAPVATPVSDQPGIRVIQLPADFSGSEK
jgi:hypothetical protein